jgi:hypothetical protein
LIVSVIRDHKYRGHGNWEPGIYIDCRDPEGHFRTDFYVTFDQCRLTPSQICRMYAFIDRWVERCQQYDEGRGSTKRNRECRISK